MRLLRAGSDMEWFVYEPGDWFQLDSYGGFHKWGYPQMDGLYWKILLRWMI